MSLLDEIQSQYDDQQIFAIYDLGRTYYRMGYYAAAERIFSGLAKIFPLQTPAEVGLGLIKIESGFIIEGREFFKKVVDSDNLDIKSAARVGIAFSYLYEGDYSRALEIMKELDKVLQEMSNLNPDFVLLAKSIVTRAEQLQGGLQPA